MEQTNSWPCNFQKLSLGSLKCTEIYLSVQFIAVAYNICIHVNIDEIFNLIWNLQGKIPQAQEGRCININVLVYNSILPSIRELAEQVDQPQKSIT